MLSVLPEMYDDIWTGAKGMYKLEPAMADGGEVVLYAPHITEFSYTHGAFLDRIGYHCRDYFLKQWDRFAGVPRGVIAHSTHLIGQGTYDAATGIETLRIKVTLATGIPEERCRRVNLNYLDPESIRLEDWQGREGEGVKLVPHAGETLYRLKNGVSGLVARGLLNRTGDVGEDVVGVRADQSYRSHDQNQNHRQHDGVLGDVLSLVFGPNSLNQLHS